MTSLGTVKPFDKTLTLWARRKVLPADQFAALGDEQKAKAGRLAGIYHTSFTQAIYDSLGKAISEGQTVRDWAPQAQQILDGFGAAKGERIYSGDTWSPWYADLVFRTATQAAYAGGRYAEMFSPEWMTAAPYWLYDATNDGRTRPEHRALDGLVFRKDDARARHFLPPAGFNCFPGDTRVKGAFRAGARAMYSGPVVTLETERHRLTLTVNHPVLTPRGWVPAGQLHEGDEIVCDPSGAEGRAATNLLEAASLVPRPERDAILTVGVHLEERPALASELFATLHGLGRVRVSKVNPEDFHGDARLFEGDVDTVDAKGHLPRHGEPPARQLVGELDLVAADAGHAFLTRAGVALHFLAGLLSTRRGFPGLRALPLGSAAIATAPFGQLGLAPSPHGYAGLRERALKEPAATSRAIGEALHALAGHVRGLENRRDHSGPNGSVAAAPRLDSPTARLRRVEVSDFRGYVYDFETPHGAMLAEGIVVSNCRCHAIELNEDDFEAGGYKLSKGQDIREALPPGWDADRVSSLVPASMRRAKPVAKTPRPAIEGTTGDGWPHDPNSLKLVKKLGGSTGAELVEDAAGNRFVRKRGANAGHVRDEFAADRMYEALGIRVPEGRLYDGPGGPVKLTRFIQGERLRDVVAAGGPRAAKVLERLQRDLAADALLGNWDVVGLDNVLVDAKDFPWRIDNGGSLRYRGAGVLKSGFSDYPIELWTLRDPKLNPDAGPMFKGTDPATVPARIRQIAARRSEILAAAPADLRAVLGARLDQLVSVADLMDEATADKWKIGYADELARHTIGIRAAGLSARMPRAMTQRFSGDMQPLDENGLAFDHLRTLASGDPSLVADLAKYIKSVGGNYAMVSAWAGSQAGSSWNPFPMAIKYLMAENRTVRLSAYFWQGGSAASEAQLKKSFAMSGEAAVRVTFAAQHAFTRELLGIMRVAGRTNASGTGISLFRTENLTSVVKRYGLSRGLLHRFARGAMESTSIYRAPTVHGSEAFRYDDVPLLRILALYFQERRPGSRSGLFLGDGENEFVAMLEGLQGLYL